MSDKTQNNDQNKDYEKGIKELTEAIKLNPNDASAYFGRGAAYVLSGQCDQGIKDLGTVKI